jgi:hypothetical protein
MATHLISTDCTNQHDSDSADYRNGFSTCKEIIDSTRNQYDYFLNGDQFDFDESFNEIEKIMATVIPLSSCLIEALQLIYFNKNDKSFSDGNQIDIPSIPSIQNLSCLVEFNDSEVVSNDLSTIFNKEDEERYHNVLNSLVLDEAIEYIGQVNHSERSNQNVSMPRAISKTSCENTAINNCQSTKDNMPSNLFQSEEISMQSTPLPPLPKAFIKKLKKETFDCDYSKYFNDKDFQNRFQLLGFLSDDNIKISYLKLLHHYVYALNNFTIQSNDNISPSNNDPQNNSVIVESSKPVSRKLPKRNRKQHKEIIQAKPSVQIASVGMPSSISMRSKTKGHQRIKSLQRSQLLSHDMSCQLHHRLIVNNQNYADKSNHVTENGHNDVMLTELDDTGTYSLS